MEKLTDVRMYEWTHGRMDGPIDSGKNVNLKTCPFARALNSSYTSDKNTVFLHSRFNNILGQKMDVRIDRQKYLSEKNLSPF